MKKTPHILSLKLSELWISLCHAGNSWKPVLAWGGQCEKPTWHSFFTPRLLHWEDNPCELWSSEPIINGWPLLWPPFCHLLWENSGSCSTAPVVPKFTYIQDRGVKCRDQTLSTARDRYFELSVLLFTAVFKSHRSYINWTWGNYTSTFAWISSSLPPCGCHKRLKIACDLQYFSCTIFCRYLERVEGGRLRSEVVFISLGKSL